MRSRLDFADAEFRGRTSPAPDRPALTGVLCLRCGSSLIGRLAKRYVRRQGKWPYQRVEVEVFLCPCRNGTRRRFERVLKEVAD
jgi:hypothetical protein